MRPGFRAEGLLILAALACAGLMACRLDGPVVSPEGAYDPDAAMRKAELAGLDSAAILLVDVKDSTHQILLWSGRPDTAQRLPVFSAADGEKFYFLIRGYLAHRGACYLAEVLDGKTTVKVDTCAAKPQGVALSTRGLPMDWYGGDFDITGIYPVGTVLRLVGDASWLKVQPDMLTARDGDDTLRTGSQKIFLGFDPRKLPLIPQRTWVRIFRDGRLVDSVEARPVNDLVRTRPLGGDTLYLGDSSYAGVHVVVVPQNHSGRWLVVPQDPWIESVFTLDVIDSLEPLLALPAGSRFAIEFILNPDKTPGPGTYVSMFYALGADSVAVDSFAVVVRGRSDDVLVGRVELWDVGSVIKNTPISVRLDGGARIAEADSQGFFRFDGVEPGRHTILATAPDRLGQGVVFDRVEGERIPAQYLPMSNAARFERIAPGWNVPRIADVIPSMAGIIAVSRGKPGGDEVILIPTDMPAAPPRIVPIGQAGPGKPPLEVAKIGGSAENLYLSFPTAHRLGQLRNLTAPSGSVRLVDIPFEPYAFASDPVDNENLMVSGRTDAGRVVIGFFSSDLSLVRIDTLDAVWDGAAPLERGPLIAVADDQSFYLTTGNGPGKPERFLRHFIGASGKDLSIDLPDPGTIALSGTEGGFMVVSALSSGRLLRTFDENLSPVRVTTVGDDVLAAGTLNPFHLLAVKGGDIVVVDMETLQVTNRFSLPGGAPATLVLSGANNLAIAVSVDKLYIARF